MENQRTSHTVLALTPLGPGDLVDRAVRFYRNNFAPFVYIAGPPVVFGAVMSLLWRMFVLTLVGRDISSDPDGAVIFTVLLWMGNVFIWTVELATMLTVMGGASLNFVRHLVYKEPISFVATYRNVKSRFFSLIAASSMMTVLFGVSGLMIFYIGLAIGVLAAVFAVAALNTIPALGAIAAIVIVLASLLGTNWLFFFIASKFACVPQAMLVEELSLSSAIARSFSLAKGTTKRLAALVLFTLLASYSALAILYVPLGWYAWVTGYRWFDFNEQNAPLWYEMCAQLIGQTSLLISMPVLMIGLCLMYVDERVRSEGFDIDVLSARNLPEPSISAGATDTMLTETGVG